MKIILKLLLVWVPLCGALHAVEPHTWPGNIVSVVGELPVPESLNRGYPETFDWQAYIRSAHSTINQRHRALQASAILWKRLLAVEERERKQRLKIHGKESAQCFDQMQQQWRKLCALECRDYAGPGTVYRGSGWKGSYPLFVAQQIHQRIKYLNIER